MKKLMILVFLFFVVLLTPRTFATGEPILINTTTDKSTYNEGDTVYFISYVNDTSGDYVKLLIDNSTDFTNCNYSVTTGCIAASSPLQTTGSPQQLNATLTASQDTTWYAKVCDDGGLCYGPNEWCYQEFANKSTNCGGLGNGSYVFDGDWNNENNLIDGDWSSYARLGGCNVGDLYMNYTIPSTVINAMVEDKYQYVIAGGAICPSFREFISISYQNSSKEIKSICDGENILGLSNNKIRDNQVIKKTEHYYNGLLYKFYGNNFELEATANHMIYVKNNGYIRADKVKIGDDFLILKENKSLSYEKVKKIESYWYNGRVYDLATETQNFFANNILVHNVYDDSRLRCYNGSEWETVKDLSDSGVLVNENATIPNSCLQGDVLQLKYHFDTEASPACYANFYEEAMWWNMSFTGSFTVSSPEVIDMTVHDVPIQFGNDDPGTVNKSAQVGNGFPMIVTIEPTTTVSTNLTLRGLNNFSSGSSYFNIGNLTYSNVSTIGTG
ncbi:MAG: hypothetical protein J7K87_03360, partial [Candidatus Aenigmarchaeota archaeon]|nr:hypothetical protein [Candidatus Aenigmarchaeota archaeon]